MRRLQFSLLGLLAVVSFVAFACAALAKPNEWWAMFVTNASLAALFVGVLAAIYGHAARRAFWIGFAVVGWGYFVVGWANAMLSNARPDDAQQFVTTRVLEWLGERTLDKSQVTYEVTFSAQPPPAPMTLNTSMAGQTISTQQVLSLAYSPTNAPVTAIDVQAMSRLMRIGHSLWAIVLGVLGGLLARAFYYRRERLVAG